MPTNDLIETADIAIAPVEMIERRIYFIRGEKVMVDADLADLYQVQTKRLNEAVHRNLNRFPPDFMFQLTAEEADGLRSQFATSNERRGGRRYLPYVFTEHGVAMLSSVLSSKHAVQMNILIIRAFIRLRELLVNHKDLAMRVEALETARKDHESIIGILADEIDDLKQLPSHRNGPSDSRSSPSKSPARLACKAPC